MSPDMVGHPAALHACLAAPRIAVRTPGSWHGGCPHTRPHSAAYGPDPGVALGQASSTRFIVATPVYAVPPTRIPQDFRHGDRQRAAARHPALPAPAWLRWLRWLRVRRLRPVRLCPVALAVRWLRLWQLSCSRAAPCTAVFSDSDVLGP